MKFKDYTIQGGRIYSERLQDAGAVNRDALKLANQMLRRLRHGTLVLGNPYTHLPNFHVSLGLPQMAHFREINTELHDDMMAPGRFFRVSMPNEIETPFQLSLVLPLVEIEGDEDESADKRAIGTLLGMSAATAAPEDRDGDAMMADLETIWLNRPFIASAILPPATEDSPLFRETVQTAAGFATAMAVAMIKEG